MSVKHRPSYPSPCPSPRGRGNRSIDECHLLKDGNPKIIGFPLPRGEGQGEGFRRTRDEARLPDGQGRGTRNDPFRFFLACSLILFASAAFARPPKVSVPPLEFTPPEAERVVLSNGVVVYLLEDHELPLFSLNMKMKVSPADEPEKLLGAMGFMGTVWRSGGTKKRDPDALDEELEFLPATVETGAGEESASISLSCLSRDIEKGLEIFGDVLFNPVFRNDRLNLAKSNMLESLRRKNDTPSSIAGRAFRDVLYGPAHVYARNMTPKKVKRVKRGHLRRFYQKVVRPDHAIAAVWGDFDTEDILKRLEALFADWVPSGRAVPEYDYTVKDPKEGGLFYVEKDFNQSRVYVGQIGLTRHHPDRFALVLADTILGGGGSSRLFGEIRSRLGLAYMVGSFFSNPKGPGLVGVGCQTKAETTVDAIRALQKEMDRFTQAEPAPDEISLARDSILNSFIFQFELTSYIVNQQARLEFLGYPEGYLKAYPAKIRAVKPADILDVSRKYYDSEKRKVLVVGDKEKFDEPLGTLGDVIVIPLDEID